MPMESAAVHLTPQFLIVGQLRRDWIILPSGQPKMDVPGGNLLYAAAGLAVWEPHPPPGLIGRVGEDFPADWLEQFTRRGFDTRGITILPQAVDVRRFIAYLDRNTPNFDNPVAHFARLGLPFPKGLLGYQPKPATPDSRTRLSPLSVRQEDIPKEYLGATAAHLCPVDYLTHNLLPSALRQAGFTILTLDPSPGYMNPSFRDDLPALIAGLTAFLPSEEEVLSLFQGLSSDLWEIAEAFASYGCEIIVIKCGERGQMLYDGAAHKRWEVSPYPARVVDPTGVGDAFCGGFLAGYRRTYDPLEAVLHGNISASLTIEGHGPFYCLDALPGLAQARMEALRQSIRRV
jgi:sugar/nucleoside kinase (ribokinase family)